MKQTDASIKQEEADEVDRSDPAMSKGQTEEACRGPFAPRVEQPQPERGAYAVARDGKVQKGRLKFEEEDSSPLHAVSLVEDETGIVLTQGRVERGDTEPKSKQPDKQAG